MNREQYPQQNTARMEKILGSSSEYGLSSKEAFARLEKYGKNNQNEKQEHPVPAFLKFVLKNGTLPIAIAGIGVSAFLLGKGVFPSALLYLSFFILSFLLFLKRERGFRLQKARLSPRVRVIRDGKRRSISPESLVKGDLILLSPGDILYTYAHVTTDSEMTVYRQRGDSGCLFIKHGGDCFEETDEPFNSLCPGDIVKEGSGAAFVTEKADGVPLLPPASKTMKNYAKVCRITTRISLFLSVALLAVVLLRGILGQNNVFLGQGILLFAILISTAGTAFYPLLFDLLFLHKNKRTMEKNNALFTSVSDAEMLTAVDTFVLSTRSMFRSAGYTVKSFETAGGRHIKEKMKATTELSLIADVLFAAKSKCELSMEEEAVLGFTEQYVGSRRFELYAKSVTGVCTLASYRSFAEGRKYSYLWGDAELLIPKLMYLCEDGKTRLLDAKQRERLLAGVRHSKKSGYRFLLFAETQNHNTPEGMPQSFSDLKLLGFFAMRKRTDPQASATLSLLKKENKKAVFIHDGETAEWLTKEIRHFEGIPILDGSKETFREELTYYVQDDTIHFCIGLHLSAFQKAQIVTVLESSGRRVAAYGSTFEDHRMLRAATAAIVPHDRENRWVPPLVTEEASVRADEHVSSQVDSVRRAPHIFGGFGVFTATLCASLLGRCAVALIGVLFGTFFLSPVYYAILGIGFDLLSFYCFMRADGRTEYDGFAGLERENRKNLSFFSGFLAGALLIGGIASFVALAPQSFSFLPGSFVLISLLLMLNVGIWRFSTARETTTRFLYPVASIVTVAAVFLLGHFTNGRFGFLFRLDLLFWALFPIALLLAVGKLTELYFAQKNTFHIGENDERM